MALQWADTFNIYGTGAAARARLLDGFYAFAGDDSRTAIVADPDPTSTQNVYRYIGDNFGNGGFRFVFPGGAKTTMGVAMRLWMAGLPANSNREAFVFSDVTNTAQVQFDIETTGVINVRQPGGTILGATPLPVLVSNAWNHIEVKVTIDNSVGSFEVRVNGASVLTLTNVDTQATANASSAQFTCLSSLGGTTSYIKDFIVWDTTGSFNNNFMGTVRCIDIVSDGDSSLTWTPNSGSTGYNILAHIPPQDDTSYIAAATTLTSTFTLANLPATVSSVRGNILKLRARKEDSGDGNTQVGLKSGASTSLGANRPITTAYTYWFDVNETDPATGAAWTPTAFNSAIFQLARTV